MTAQSARQFTGRHMLIIMVLFFGVVIAVNITMAMLATSTWSGLLAKNGYVASIDYAHNDNARKAARERGWTIDLTAPDGVVHLHAVDRAGQPLPTEGTVTVDAADQRSPSMTLPFTADGDTLRTSESLPAGRYVLWAKVGDGPNVIEWRSAVIVSR
ncbi:MAG: FixH family protein [Pseudomonadota bacterium]